MIEGLNEMIVVYASDDNFAPVLGVSVTSLFENNHSCKISVYILDSGISENNRVRLEGIANDFGQTLIFVNANSHFQSNMKHNRGSAATFTRLYMAKLLPDDVPKALYLDCDIIIEGNLEVLWNTDISEHYAAGVRDCISRRRRASVELTDSDNYINAGVMLVNLDKWRKDNITEGFLEFSHRYKGKVPYADQGIINGVLKGGILSLGAEFNCFSAMYDFSYEELMLFRRPVNFYSEKEIAAAKGSPCIVHFTTSFLSLRPWVKESKHPYTKKWLDYYIRSPWADEPLKEDSTPIFKRFCIKIYKRLPDFIAVRIAGLLHSEIIPLLKG